MRVDMAQLPKEFDFLTDPSLDPEIKKTLLAGLLEEKRHARDNDLKVMEAQASQALEKKKLWHNTPLMLALVGTISVLERSSGVCASRANDFRHDYIEAA